ncbi:uncharacterized protein BXZ73DRAFT_92298 [Epithele typhae]|uniref:uncharacterized protein n=1 Tax=Epithele typhae TaxID=378194 RepID=UPI0020085197|nr:uncharacterized protein BXZ73DRAFT_92298 [Epithele typhae]KAH9918250.1 hypothetical protein BXZ73DRAFT_92298 [Epithele typhae]
MKYIALLSGGKDSCYNLLHCSKNGHELIAAASLRPEQGKEELDSYLYQTVGQDAIEFVGRALDVPLYRRVIYGAAVEQGGEYGGRDPASGSGTSGDETEDLYDLLTTVKSHHPDVQGVSVGAILSNYQRVRVEHVCRRLGMTPLCYLWQRDQEELLSEMIEAGMEAILIKVAGIGLTTKHLGKTLAQMQPTLMKLNALYGSHVCGEGGEYESLTLDCPLFKSRIKLDEVQTVVHSDNDFATVAYLRIKEASLVPKDSAGIPEIAIPPVLSEPFQDIFDIVETAKRWPEETTNGSTQNSMVPIAVTKRLGRWVSVANIQREDIQDPEMSLEDEVRFCFGKLQESLAAHGLTLANCTNINIFLSSMELFGRVNAVYATYFGTSPPARACVALDLPPRIHVRVDCIAFAERSPTDRQALHVQGLSYWAPANIGPYSQAIVADERVFISGQIGLIPSRLSLPSPPSLAMEAALAFQHAHRVVEALKTNSGGGWQGHMQGVIYWLAHRRDIPAVRTACVKHNEDSTAPALFAVVPELPKGALVEKQVLVHTGQCDIEDDDGTIVRQTVVPTYNEGRLEDSKSNLHWEVSFFKETFSTVALVCVKGEDPSILEQLRTIPPLLAVKNALSIRLFYNVSKSEAASAAAAYLTGAPITPIPCRHLASRHGDDWDYTILATCTGVLG